MKKLKQNLIGVCLSLCAINTAIAGELSEIDKKKIVAHQAQIFGLPITHEMISDSVSMKNLRTSSELILRHNGLTCPVVKDVTKTGNDGIYFILCHAPTIDSSEPFYILDTRDGEIAVIRK